MTGAQGQHLDIKLFKVAIGCIQAGAQVEERWRLQQSSVLSNLGGQEQGWQHLPLPQSR